MTLESLLERDVVPDVLIRAAIRRLLRGRLSEFSAGGIAAERERAAAFLAERREGPIARVPEAANAQHYEVPPAFYRLCLGPRLKYSGGYWPTDTTTLAESEDAMLALTCERAGIADGQRILDLGCGWGALTFWLAEHYPSASITAVSNSVGQRQWIESEALRRGLDRIEVQTADMNVFVPSGPFDRIVSVEMFEHLWNHEKLMRRLSAVLAAEGRLFIHIFTHARVAYPFVDRGPDDWMARHFFTGGTMLNDDALLHAECPLQVRGHWRVDGTHYARTSEAWLATFDGHRNAADRVIADIYGPREVTRWRVRWRVFFLACAELFAFRAGQEWLVSHYTFEHAR